MTSAPDHSLDRAGAFRKTTEILHHFAVVASESMQHQSVAEVYRTFAILFHCLPLPLRRQADGRLNSRSTRTKARGERSLPSD